MGSLLQEKLNGRRVRGNRAKRLLSKRSGNRGQHQGPSRFFAGQEPTYGYFKVTTGSPSLMA